MVDEEIKENVSIKSKKTLPSVGKLLTDTWKIYKENFKQFFGIVIIPSVLVFVFGFFLVEDNTILMIVSSILTVMLSYWLMASLIFAFKNRGKIDIKTSLEFGIQKLFPLFFVSILYGIIVMAGIVLLVVPGIIFLIWFFFSNYVLIYQNKGGMSALLKSRKLVIGNWWGVFGRLLAMIIIVSIIFAIISLPLSFLTFNGNINLFTSIIELLINLFVLPFFTCYSGLLYENLSEVKEDTEIKKDTNIQQ